MCSANLVASLLFPVFTRASKRRHFSKTLSLFNPTDNDGYSSGLNKDKNLFHVSAMAVLFRGGNLLSKVL